MIAPISTLQHENDIGEKENLSEQYPEKVEKLTRLMESFLKNGRRILDFFKLRSLAFPLFDYEKQDNYNLISNSSIGSLFPKLEKINYKISPICFLFLLINIIGYP